MARCDECKANKVCDHNRFGFENCGNFIPDDVAPMNDVAIEVIEFLALQGLLNVEPWAVPLLKSTMAKRYIRRLMK